MKDLFDSDFSLSRITPEEKSTPKHFLTLTLVILYMGKKRMQVFNDFACFTASETMYT